MGKLIFFYYNKLRKETWLFLILPVVVILSIFFFYPLFTVFKTSVYKYVFPNIVKKLTLENYSRFLLDVFYLSKVLLPTFKLSILATLTTLIIGYPFAYFLSKMKNPGIRRLLFTSIILVLWVNEVCRILGWVIILSDKGIVNSFLMKIGFISTPIPFMYNELSVFIALVQVSIPYMVISLLGVFNYIDPSLEEAAKTLGANNFITFFKITIPLSIPGILAGTLIVFALNVNAFSIPLLMGGNKVSMIGLEIYKYSMEVNNLPFASAMSVILLLIVLLIFSFYTSFLNKFYKGY
jgi:putative spermidine/putrescine transport system permease protein